MVDDDLIDELDSIAAKVGGISRLQPDEANVYVEKLADAYVGDRARLWWWEALKVPATCFGYSEGDGLSKLAKLVEKEGGAALVVTDDEEPPWPVYVGSVQDIIKLLRGCWFFEYILVAQDVSWVVFDTHMNELVVAGRLTHGT